MELRRFVVLGAAGVVGRALVPMIIARWPKADVHSYDMAWREDGRYLGEVCYQKDLDRDPDPLRRLRPGDVVVDLCPALDKIEVLNAADASGASVLNTTCVGPSADTSAIVDLALDERLTRRRGVWMARHSVLSGMNPGTVSALAKTALGRLAADEIAHIQFWEIESGAAPDGSAIATWSPEEFVSELANEPTFVVRRKGDVCYPGGAPADNVFPLTVLPCPDKPSAPGHVYLCEHEEVLTAGWKWNTATRFLYGFAGASAEAIRRMLDNWTMTDYATLPVARKMNGLTGADVVGVTVTAGDGRVAGGYAHLDHQDARVALLSNATATLAAAGAMAGLESLERGGPPGLVLPEDQDADAWLAEVSKHCEVGYFGEGAHDTGRCALLPRPKHRDSAVW